VLSTFHLTTVKDETFTVQCTEHSNLIKVEVILWLFQYQCIFFSVRAASKQVVEHVIISVNDTY